MAVIKDGWVDPHELALAIAEQQRERKNKALELRIAEKADFITKILGREYSIDNYSVPSLFPSYYTVYQKGNAYQGNFLKIESGIVPKEMDEKEKELKFVKISLLKKERGIFRLPITSFKDVYLQRAYEGEEIEVPVLEQESLWLSYFDSLYELACKQKDFEEVKDNVRKLEIIKH